MVKNNDTHENFSSTHAVTSGSDRSFGLVFSVVFVLIGLWPLIEKSPPRFWAFGISVGFLVTALTYPKLLSLLNRGWTKFGELLQFLINPIILGVVFFALFVPLGLLMRLRGKSVLDLHFDNSAKSYWVEISGNSLSPSNMEKQY